MPDRICFTGDRQVTLEPFEVDPPAPGQILVRATRSLISSGTESIVFTRRFEPRSHWDQWVKYPFYPGYALCGVVEAVGDVDNAGRRVGERVVCRVGHASHALLPAAEAFPVPEGVSDEDACWFALGKITSMGARAARYTLGDSLLVIGAGPIGQMSVRWAHACGVERIIVVDPITERLDLARRGGATATFDAPLETLRDRIVDRNDGRLPRLVMDTTGNHHVLASALGLADRFGSVILMGDTGTPTGQHLTSDVVIRGVRIVGAHDGHEEGTWNAPRIYRLFFRLLASGRLEVDGLCTNVFSPDACEQAYRTAADRAPGVMGITFDWSR